MSKACQALHCNLSVLAAFQEESRNRRRSPDIDREHDRFDRVTGDVVRELSFTRDQLALTQNRLERTITQVWLISTPLRVILLTRIQIRDVLNLRNIHNVEQLGKRSIEEAKSVKFIAVLTFLFLPPSLTTVSTTFEMNMAALIADISLPVVYANGLHHYNEYELRAAPRAS